MRAIYYTRGMNNMHKVVFIAKKSMHRIKFSINNIIFFGIVLLLMGGLGILKLISLILEY